MANFPELKAATELAIEHVIDNGLDDIAKPPMFRPSLEMEVITSKADEFRQDAKNETLKFLRTANLANVGIGNPQYYMVPKDQHTLRRVAWIDPFDLVKYLAVSLLLFPHIEKARADKNLNIIHSHRRSDQASKIFDENYGYNSFRAASSILSQQRLGEWKVITDISNFFDRIGNHPLENHLIDCGCDPNITRLGREILFQWSGDRRSFGVPVGSDASRILSEAALLAVDRQLQEQGISYLRYVDDFRFFAGSRAEAYDIVRLLSELLAEEGLTLNNRKTNIFKIQSFEELQETTEQAITATHDKIDENERIEIKRRVQVSGRTSISRFYKHPGRDALRRLKSLSYQEVVAQVTSTSGAEQEEAIRTATKYFIYVRQDVQIIELLLQTKMTSVFYVVDALVKDHDAIHPQVRVMARDVLLSEMGAEICSYPFQIPLLRLCATTGYEDGTLANAVIDRQRHFDNPQFFREATLLSFAQMDRQKIRRMAQEVYQNVAAPMQRSILFAVLNYSRMNEDQRRPILRNLRQSSSDWFIKRL
ncbi:MAG: RNA-directed DNA polymerase [Pseudomonadota bacterium]